MTAVQAFEVRSGDVVRLDDGTVAVITGRRQGGQGAVTRRHFITFLWDTLERVPAPSGPTVPRGGGQFTRSPSAPMELIRRGTTGVD